MNIGLQYDMITIPGFVYSYGLPIYHAISTVKRNVKRLSNGRA